MIKFFNICLLAALFYTVNPAFSQSGVTSSSYKDALIEVNNCSILLKNTYTRKNLFTRTTVYFTNPTENYAILDAQKIFLVSEKSGKIPCLYNRFFVIAPQTTRKFNLKFPAKNFGSESVSFEINSLDFTTNKGKGYEKQELPVKQEKWINWENINVEVLSKTVFTKTFSIKLRVTYSGNGFLAINQDKVALQFIDPYKICYNTSGQVRQHHYFTPGNKAEDIIVFFPLDCIPENDRNKTLVFENVFTELSVTTKAGGYVTAAKLSDDSNNNPIDEKEGEKEEQN